MDGLKVTGVGGETGDILELRYKSVSNLDGQKILRAIVEAYQEFLGTTQKSESEVAIRLIGEAKGQLDTEISGLQETYQKFKTETPLLYTGAAAQNVHEERLKALKT